MVELDADASLGRRNAAHGLEVTVPLPVGVDDVVAEGTAPGLAVVDVGAEGDGLVRGDDEAVGPTEGAVEKAAVIMDAVHRREERRVDAGLGHVAAERS